MGGGVGKRCTSEGGGGGGPVEWLDSRRARMP